MEPKELLSSIAIASPCKARWDEMSGDSRCRLCALCDKNVYDLSRMTGDEAVRLIREKEGNICARLHRRSDGTVITADCSVGVRQLRSRRRRLVAAAAAGILGLASTVLGSTLMTSDRPPTQTASTQGSQKLRNFITEVKIWLGLASPPPRVIMGVVCVPDPMLQSPPGGTQDSGTSAER